jgi:LEA14-like dessication related protein
MIPPGTIDPAAVVPNNEPRTAPFAAGLCDTLLQERLMRRNKSFAALVALMTVLVLGGCTSRMYKQPEITLQGVQLGGLGLRGGTLLVNLQVANPNRFTLSAHTLRYDLRIGDHRQENDSTWVDFASGVYDQPFSVGARETATIQIPIEFSYTGLSSATATILRTGTFDYAARGTVDARTPVGTYTVPFQRRGTVTMMGAAR